MTMDITKSEPNVVGPNGLSNAHNPNAGNGGGNGAGNSITSAANTAHSGHNSVNNNSGSGGSQLCAGCGKHIQDRFLLKALDMLWHEDCLKCGCCDCRLGEVGSTLYTKGNLMLCKRDYLRFVSKDDLLIPHSPEHSWVSSIDNFCTILGYSAIQATAPPAAKWSRHLRWWWGRAPMSITWNASLVNSAITGQCRESRKDKRITSHYTMNSPLYRLLYGNCPEKCIVTLCVGVVLGYFLPIILLLWPYSTKFIVFNWDDEDHYVNFYYSALHQYGVVPIRLEDIC